MSENETDQDALQPAHQLEPIAIGLGSKPVASPPKFTQPQKKICSKNIQPPSQLTSSAFGLTTELQFQIEAIRHGLEIYNPMDCRSRTDVVIHNGHRFLRIQIKGIAGLKERKQLYRKRLGSAAGFYASTEVDFFAIYIAPESAWFIVRHEDAPNYFQVYPDQATSKQRSREAWHLLKDAR